MMSKVWAYGRGLSSFFIGLSSCLTLGMMVGGSRNLASCCRNSETLSQGDE